MPMFAIELAGIRIGMDNRYPFIERQCRGYYCEPTDLAFTVSATPEEIAEEQKLGDFSEGYCESICLYRHICQTMPQYNVFLFHACVLEVDGWAYAFTAKSGVGKSTHCSLWLKNVPGARVLNGDKPLIRLEEDGSVTAHGTPWNGKHGLGTKITVPLKGLCILERAEENSIRPVTLPEVLPLLMQQSFRPRNPASVHRVLELLSKLSESTGLYRLGCNLDPQAAMVAYQGMNRKDNEV
jgi:hypothetical protein